MEKRIEILEARCDELSTRFLMNIIISLIMVLMVAGTLIGYLYFNNRAQARVNHEMVIVIEEITEKHNTLVEIVTGLKAPVSDY